MLETILILTAFFGSLLAGIIDLKTTEIPDEIPYIMMGIGIVGNLIKSYLVWGYWPILMSLVAGFGFLLFGFFMYYSGQWGGGDAKVLSGMGFLLPSISSRFTENLFFPFPLSYFFNVFLIGAIYMILYVLVMSLFHKRIWSVFMKDLKASSRSLLLLNAILFFSVLIVGVSTAKYYRFSSIFSFVKFGFITILGSLGLFLLYRFAKTVEDVGFKKRISVKDLKEGDVLLDSKIWEGLTKKQVMEIKRSKKRYVWIKEGVRFAPVFSLGLVFTLFIGDGVILLIGLI